MSIKYLLHDKSDLERIPHIDGLTDRVSSKSFPVVVELQDGAVITGPFDNASPGQLKEVESLRGYVHKDTYPLLDVNDTYIVQLLCPKDCRKLYELTESWSRTTFQDPGEWMERPFFVVSKGKRCRWYRSEQQARQVVPWAPLVTVSELEFAGVETFNEISLEEVLCIG